MPLLQRHVGGDLEPVGWFALLSAIEGLTRGMTIQGQMAPAAEAAARATLVRVYGGLRDHA